MRYVLRRLMQSVPTVFGVLLVTFVLFHVVSGSPAVLVLGQNAAPLSLEEFDEQKGFNKPLLAGRWVRTRAFADADFHKRVDSLDEIEGVEHVRSGAGAGWLKIRQGGVLPVPLAFPLRSHTAYRWEMAGRLAEGGEAVWITRFAGGREKTNTLAAASSRGRIRVDVPACDAAITEARLVVLRGEMDLRHLRLRRAVPRWWDSQLVFYFRQLARLDLGVSAATNQPVARMLAEGLGPSLALTVPIFLVGLAAAVSLALLCAYTHGGWPDRLILGVAVTLMSVNYLVWIVVGQFVFAYKLGWFPVWGFESWRHLALPVLIGVISGLGADTRFYRAIMLEEIGRDYVRTAKAKGVKPFGMLFRHVLRNAMIPISTHVAMTIPFLYTGSLLLESFFGIPGLGGVGINAINSADVDVVRGVVLVGSVLYILAGIISDVVYMWLDPRVRLR